tara:strand:- start:648 stop:1709 length:1062 start_codon:yes stop_codon:yes gene_type:complete
MKHYYGIVEDRQDPLKIGRVRVRIHGIHSDRKDFISTPDLPWAQVMLPTTSAGLSGFGTQHGLVEGSTVIIFFKDEETLQQPVVIGSTAGIPQSGYKEDGTDVLITRQIDKGFNDPRGLTVSAYEGKPDGANPDHAPTRGFGLTTALDTAPKIYESRDISYIGKGSSITEPTITEDDLPYYPLYTDKSDLSKLADTTDEKDLHAGRDIIKDILPSKKEIKSPAKPVYPYNKVLQSESGHVIEVDDTPSAERIAIEHRSGTFQEIHPDGSQVTRVVNDNYTIICKDEEVFVGGKVDIKVLGDAKIETIGKLELKSYSDGKIDVVGKLDIESGGDLTLKSATQVSVKAPKFSPNS